MNSLTRYAIPFYSIMRLIVGLMFFCHGAQKIFGWFSPPGQHAGALPPLMLAGGWIEIVGGVLIAVGLFTRVAAFIASGEMAVAFFMMHRQRQLLTHREQRRTCCRLLLSFLLHLPLWAWRLEPRCDGAQDYAY